MPIAPDLLVVSMVVSTAHQLQDPTNGYEVISYNGGAGPMRRNTQESADIPGRILLDAIEDVMLGTVGVRVKAANLNTLKTRYGVLIGWMRQIDYSLTATVSLPASPASTWIESWRCEPADFAEPVMDSDLLGNAMTEITFEWPHSPIAL